MRLRLVGIATALALAAGCVGSSPGASPNHDPSPSTARPAGPASLRLWLSAAGIRAGGCVLATVRAPVDAVTTVQIGGAGASPATVRIRAGVGRARICEPWTPAGSLQLRASAPGFLPSSAVALQVRPAPWMRQLERVLRSLPVSVSVGDAGRTLYGHLGEVPRIPASNQKLLLSMTLFDRFGTRRTIPTTAEATAVHDGMVRGDLWLVGHGDPEVGPATLERLAFRIRADGVRSIGGSVVGDTSLFTRERWAPGWEKIALQFISVPTALTFEANEGPNGFVFDPERLAAAQLTDDLRALGVSVNGGPRTGSMPPDTRTIATVRSAPLVDILRRQNIGSLNLDAEVLDKLLGAATAGPPGTIAKGSAAIEAWAKIHGVAVVARDAAGLSYDDRISTDGLVRLLGVADASPWGGALRTTLAAPGEGTLAGRLEGLRVRAKTGTLLHGVSALSGWVGLRHARRWLEFSILSKGLTKARALATEDEVVTILANLRRP